ncbi:MAG: sugar phosphate isomerase/epimerase [Planctomycetota bacterium]|nr:sugar phosphate isomerase/epimerase [Planctomycetota bacterium]
MKLVLFTKFLKDKDAAGLVAVAKKHGLDGYDLCVRDGYVVSPQNAGTALPVLVKALAAEGLSVPMVTGPGDLVRPDHPSAEKILAAMRTAGVPLLKLGYVLHDPATDYWERVAETRRAFATWEKLGEKHGVRIMYHTHSCHDKSYYLGLNCAALMHLLRDFNPQYIGAYIDAGHMTVDGEPFAFGVSMVRQYLAAVALKDVACSREQNGDEGRKHLLWVPAGEGVVAWSQVFAELRRIGFTGPLSVHCEFEAKGPADFQTKMEREIAYFSSKVRRAG